MNLKPEKLGAEPKKLALLAGLVLVAGYFYFSSSSPSSSEPPQPRHVPGTATVSNVAAAPGGRAAWRGSDNAGHDSLADWKPSVKRKKGFDPTSVDPTLKLALLDKVRSIPLEGGQRSLFDFSQEPVKEAVVKIADTRKKGMPPLPGPVAAVNPPAPAAPVAPPIPLKFYGFVSATETRRAFFLDGDDIVVAREGDVIKKRYKVVRIGINSAVLEDEQFKSEQTLALVQEQEG